MTYGDKTIFLSGKLNNCFCLVDVGRQGFFYKDGYTGLNQRFCQGIVFGGWGGYGDGVNLADKFSGILYRFAAVFFCKPFCLVLVNIDYGDKVALRQIAINSGVYFAHLADANYSSAEFVHFNA
jgi:hypothetical protein